MATKIKNQNPSDSKVELFKFYLKAEKQQKTFDTIFKAKNGDWSAIKPELTKDKSFTPETVRNLEFTYHLADWSKKVKEQIKNLKKTLSKRQGN